MAKFNPEIKCSCGVNAVLLATVKFPDRKVEEYCDRRCPKFRAAMKRADVAWSTWRKNRAAGDLGRQQALAAKAAKPKPGSAEAKALAQKKESERRARQFARAHQSSAARGKSGK